MGALLSPCGLYRYKLTREWGNGPSLAFLMLNPSTADAELDDPTIRRCRRFACDAGYTGLVVGNLFAWRASNPADLKKASAPIGPDNDTVLSEIIIDVSVVVCAWGVGGSFGGRAKYVLQMILDAGKVPHCLQMTRAGHPAHPLYLPAILRPVPMNL